MLALDRSLNYSLLELSEHNQVINDIEELRLRRRQHMNVRFVLRQLIYTAKWKFDYPIFRPVKKKKKKKKERIIVTILNVNPCLDVLMYLKELTIAQLAMIFGLLQVKRIKT